MSVIHGRFAEARVYWRYVLALFRPGVEVPTFGAPEEYTGYIEFYTDDDLKLIIDEGRRQVDRQLADLEKNRLRAVTMLTIGLAEIAVLSAGAHRVFSHGPTMLIIWSVSVALAILAIGGAASLLTSRAAFGRVDTRTLASDPVPVLTNVAHGYAQAVSVGEETIRTRITVLRDGVSLAVVSAVLYALIWPFTSTSEPAPPTPSPTRTGAPTPCPMTSTPCSVSPPTPTTVPASPNPTATGGRAPSTPPP